MSNQQSLLTVEAQVVGAVLANDGLFARAAFLEEDAFSDDANAQIWRIICEMKKQGLFPRLLTSRSPARVAARGREGRKEGERKRSNAKVADAWQRRR